jgi:hypothetical protein
MAVLHEKLGLTVYEGAVMQNQRLEEGNVVRVLLC